MLQNALTHRDYSKNAPIRICIFDNRVEIVSPGKLPNGLTVENIKRGNAVVRNNLIVSYSSKLMRYRGFGSGIVRALQEQPRSTFGTFNANFGNTNNPPANVEIEIPPWMRSRR